MPSFVRNHREIALVLGLFIVLATLYSTTTPLFEAPDEQWHYAFVQHIATGRGLPVQTPGNLHHLARQEGSQPPLYYLLAAATTSWVDTSDFPGIVWENPHYGFNVPGIVNDNKNLFIHTALESFPYHGAPLAIHLARLVSVLMGALAVLFTYLLTLEIFPDRKFLAASAGAFAGFVPQFLFVTSAVSNDSTIVAMSALSLWMTIRLFLVKPRVRDAVLLGAATGLAALAKVSGLGLAILGALVLTWVSTHPHEWHTNESGRTQKIKFDPRLSASIRVLVPFGITFLAVAGWWYIRNVLLYHDITGTATMIQIFGARETPLTTMQLVTQLREVWETFWVGFGWGNVRAPSVWYTLFEVIAGASLLGLLLAFVRRRERLHPTIIKALPFFALAFWVIVAFIELVNWMQITQAPHGRLFFPALPAIAPLAVFGISQWLPRRLEPIAARSAATILVVMATLAPFLILQPAYAFPPSLDANHLPSNLQRVNIRYDDQIQLLGYSVSPRGVLPGNAVTLTLYWQALAAMSEDYSIGIHLIDSNGHVIASRDSYPGHGLLPTRLWHPGQIIRDDYWVPIADTATPGVAQIQISLYSRESRRELLARDPGGQVITPLIGQIKIASPNSSPLPHAQYPLDFVFGRQTELIGYDIQKGSQKLTLYWKRLAPIDIDYTVFVHVLDANGKIVAQKDQTPANGSNPTSLWEDGEIVVDPHTLDLPKDVSGTFQITVGMYRADTGERLPVTSGKEDPGADSVIIGSFGVVQ